MNRLILTGILWCLAISISSAQEAATPKEESSQSPSVVIEPSQEPIPSDSKAIVLVIDADAQQSEVVKQVVEALEKAGIATGKTAETAPPANSSISVTLGMRKDESYEKIKTLIEALRSVGVQQMSFREGGVNADREKQNVLILNVHPGHTTDELQRIESAAQTAAKECRMPLVVAARGQVGTEAGEFFIPRERASSEESRGQEDANFPAMESDKRLQINADPNQSRVVRGVVNGLGLSGVASEGTKYFIAVDPEESVTVVVRARSDESSQNVLELIQHFRGLGIHLFSIQSGDAGENFATVIVGPRVPSEMVERLRTEMRKFQETVTRRFSVEVASPSAIIKARTFLEASKQQVIANRAEMQRLEISSSDARILRCDDLIADIDVKIRDVDKLILEQRFEPSVWLPNPEVLETKVLRLKHTQAASVVKYLRELVAGESFRAVADERTNSLIVTGTPEQLQAAENLLSQMDVAAPTESSWQRPAAAPTLMNAPSNELQKQIAQLRSDYETANKQAHKLGDSLRQTPDAAKKAVLRTAVQRAFTLRQSLLRAELLEMQTRLLQTQQSLDMRERIADQIVDRRVEDLLNPQLEWEGSPQSAPVEGASTAVPGPSNPPAPIGLGLPEEIDEGAWGEPQNGLRLAIVVKSQNAIWNESQEVQYVVENVSTDSISLRDQK